MRLRLLLPGVMFGLGVLAAVEALARLGFRSSTAATSPRADTSSARTERVDPPGLRGRAGRLRRGWSGRLKDTGVSLARGHS
jgi:hypothetical protein